MKEMVFEVVVSVLVLLLLIITIELFRSNMDIIQNTADVTLKTQKLKIDDWIPIMQAKSRGSDVAAVVRYYSTNPNVQINVIAGRVSKTYITESFILSEWQIPLFYEQLFDTVYQYEGENGDISRIIYTILH